MKKRTQATVDNNYFKGRYAISFYSLDDELVWLFDNINEIARFEGVELGSKEFKTLRSRISNAVHKKCKLNTRFMFIGGRYCRPILIDMFRDDINEEILL